jgi:hypothetical protein
MARQAGRFVSQVRFMAQNALDQLKEEADLKDINLPDLQVGSLRQQARDYIRELMDIEGQLAELQQARTELEAAVKGQSPNGGEQAEKAKEDGAPPAPPPVDLDAT